MKKDSLKINQGIKKIKLEINHEYKFGGLIIKLLNKV